jgi:hypothetical protein
MALFLSTVRSTLPRSDTRLHPGEPGYQGQSRSCQHSKARDYQRHLKEHDPDQESNAANATSSSASPCRTKAGSCQSAIDATFLDGNWVLDLFVHRADMPVLPGNSGSLPFLGLGLWNHPRAAACVEFVLVAAGAIMYWRAAMEVEAQIEG